MYYTKRFTAFFFVDLRMYLGPSFALKLLPPPSAKIVLDFSGFDSNNNDNDDDDDDDERMNFNVA